VIYTTIFNRLNDNISTIGANTVSSGNTLESTKRPLVYIDQQSRILIERDSCLKRQEEVLFEIHAVSQSFSELDSILAGIESVLDWSNLNSAYDTSERKLLTVEWQGRSRGEPKAGRFAGSVSYRIVIETGLGSRLISKTNVTSQRGIFGNLRQRFNNHPQLNNLVSDFTSGEFVNESSKRPFIFTEGYVAVETGATTKTRQETESFALVVDEFLPGTVEILQQQIMNVYDYGKLVDSNKTFMLMEWVGSELFELESNLWRGKINYELTQEKTLI